MLHHQLFIIIMWHENEIELNIRISACMPYVYGEDRFKLNHYLLFVYSYFVTSLCPVTLLLNVLLYRPRPSPVSSS